MDRYLVYGRIDGRMVLSLWVLMLMGMDRYLARYIIRIDFRGRFGLRGRYGGGRQKIYISAEREGREAFGGGIYTRNSPPYSLLFLLSSREEFLSLFPPLPPHIT